MRPQVYRPWGEGKTEASSMTVEERVKLAKGLAELMKRKSNTRSQGQTKRS